MTKTRFVTTQNLNEFASQVIAHAKNGPRAVFRQLSENGPITEITYSDLPQNGNNYNKIMKHQPECLWGVYNAQAKPEWIVSDLSVKV